jgi:hypothetical protein
MRFRILLYSFSFLLGTFPLGSFSEPEVLALGKKLVQQGESIPASDSIKMTGHGQLFINQSVKQNLTLEVDEKVRPLIEIAVKEGVLYIDLKATKEHPIEDTTKINYYLNINELKNIEVSGAISIFIPEGLKSNTLNLNIKSARDSELNLKVERLIANIAGTGKVKASGTAKTQEVVLSGAATFNGRKLKGQEGSITIKGAGVATMNICDHLTVDISGLGEVEYCGSPKLIKKIVGTGTLSQTKEGECE